MSCKQPLFAFLGKNIVLKFLKCASLPNSDAVPLLEVGGTLQLVSRCQFRISPHVLPSCISGFFFWFPACYMFASLSCHIGMLWSEICAISTLATLQKCFHQLWSFGPLTCTRSGCLLWQSVCTSASFFFFLQSDTSEISALFSYGESGIDGDRQTEPAAHYFSLSYLASTIKCFLPIATNYHHTRV